MRLVECLELRSLQPLECVSAVIWYTLFNKSSEQSGIDSQYTLPFRLSECVYKHDSNAAQVANPSPSRLPSISVCSPQCVSSRPTFTAPAWAKVNMTTP